MSSITSKYLGRPFTQMPPVPTMSMSSLDLSMGGMPGQQGHLGGPPSLDLDLLSGCSSGMPYQMPAPVTEMERPMMVDMATRAMDELIRLAQAGDQIWVKGMPGDAREMLNVATYDSLFSKPGVAFRPPDMNVEGSRDSGLVFMSAVALVDVFMDTVRTHSFPFLYQRSRTWRWWLIDAVVVAEQVDGVLPRHRVQGADRRCPRERLGREERVLDHGNALESLCIGNNAAFSSCDHSNGVLPSRRCTRSCTS